MAALIWGLQNKKGEELKKDVEGEGPSIPSSPSETLKALGLIKDLTITEGIQTFRLDKHVNDDQDSKHSTSNVIPDATETIKSVLEFYFSERSSRSVAYGPREDSVKSLVAKSIEIEKSKNHHDEDCIKSSWIIFDVGAYQKEFTPNLEAILIRSLKFATSEPSRLLAKSSTKWYPRILWIANSSEGAESASYISVRYGKIRVVSAGDGLHNNCTAFERSLKETESHEGPAIVVYDASASGSNPFTMCQKPYFVWNGNKFDSPPASQKLHRLLDPSFDVLLRASSAAEATEAFRAHEVGRETRRARAHERIRALNRIDPAKIVRVFYGSESPSKNAFGLAVAFVDLVVSKGFKVGNGGAPEKLDGLGDALEGVAGTNVIVIISTAGVGEFPSGSKKFGERIFPHALEPSYEAVLGRSSEGDDALKASFRPRSFAVFGLGDVDYHLSERNKLDSYGTPWSYCTPAKILDRRFEAIASNAKRLGRIGFGGANSYRKDFDSWSAEVVNALSSDDGDTATKKSTTEASVPTKKPLHPIEIFKMTSKQLKQPLLNELLDPARPDDISEAALQISKHHGIYQQRRRDELFEDPETHPQCSFMIRLRMPGGTITTTQMRALLRIGETYANHTMKITTRQTVQYHGVIKRNLIDTIHAMNRACLDTVAACGDVNRNVMCTVVRPRGGKNVDEIYTRAQNVAHEISEILMPEGLARTWYDIWVAKGRSYRKTDKKDRFHIGNREIHRAVAEGRNPEPVLGKAYLPRKFKVAIAIPPFNDPDVFSHCVGFIAIVEGGRLVGFNVTAGGGMGTTKHGLYKAYARLANVIGFCTPEDAKYVALALMEIQRDHGVRTDRSHARFKYTVEDLGVSRIRSEVRKRLHPSARLDTARPYKLETNKDIFGKRVNPDRTRDYTLYMQNGRIKDYGESKVAGRVSKVNFWSAIERICEDASSAKDVRFVFSNNQNVTISRVPEALSHRIEETLTECGIPFRANDIARTFSPLMLNSMACVAFPTCGLAMAPSETYLPTLIAKIEEIMDDFDFTRDERDIVIRMSGCPNGCSRPYMGEICLVGRSFSPDVGGIYDLFLGGLPSSERLAVRHKTGLNETEILKELRGILKRFKAFRLTEDSRISFGDFVVEAGIVEACRASPLYEAHNERQPAITFWPRSDSSVRKYLKVMYDNNVDNIQDTLRNNYSKRIADQYERSLDF